MNAVTEFINNNFSLLFVSFSIMGLAIQIVIGIWGIHVNSQSGSKRGNCNECDYRASSYGDDVRSVGVRECDTDNYGLYCSVPIDRSCIPHNQREDE